MCNLQNSKPNLHRGGSKRLRDLKIWNLYLRTPQGTAIKSLIYVVDSSDRTHVEESAIVFWKFVAEISADIPILILANKQDLECHLSAKEIAVAFNLQKLQPRPYKVHPTVASNREGIWDGIDWLVDVWENT